MMQRAKVAKVAIGMTSAMVLSACMLTLGVSTSGATFTAIKPYLVPVGDDYTIRAAMSVGDKAPRTSNPAQTFQLVGIPDGMGVRPLANGQAEVFVSHELVNSAVSEPIDDQPKWRGAFVSKVVLDASGGYSTGDVAYTKVYNESTLIGDAAAETNSTPAFNRFCSGSLAGTADGFDRPIYFTNEESGAATFDPLGGSSVAIFDGEAHALPKLGHFAKENTVAQPQTAGTRTVLMTLEDGPGTPDSQLYMYVGNKDAASANVLRKNGLDNGKLYTFRASTAGLTEDTFQSGTVAGSWVEIANAGSLDANATEIAADAAGAMGFYRIEDGAFSKTDLNTFYFVTTGAGGANTLGRLYKLELAPGNPLGAARVTLIDNANRVRSAGGDTALSPDNIDASAEYLMVQEDGTATSRPEMAKLGRDGSIWRYDLRNNMERKRVAVLNPPGRDGRAVVEAGQARGIWESSGAIDASSVYGYDSWIVNVQAHAPTIQPKPNTIEDGQILIMRPTVQEGYWLAAADGGVFAYGDAGFFGSMGGARLNQPIVGLDSTRTGRGYSLVASDGGVFSFGDAGFFGSLGGVKLNAPIVAMSMTPSNQGYWLVAADGGVFAFGDAAFLGSVGDRKLNSPIVAISPTPLGDGYFLYAKDGGVFAFGAATFNGGLGRVPSGVGLAGGDSALSMSNSYWMVDATGKVFAFGSSKTFGDLARIDPSAPIVAMSSTPSDGGYVLAGADGGVFAFGDARYLGGLGSQRLNAPIVAIDAVRS